ncbi:MAG: glycine cleavage system protein GcvH [Candidatus Latescibacteria bacterium]|nr:glycine cleavage system protein GcvH [Candidatus Latescibacterota bacterium]
MENDIKVPRDLFYTNDHTWVLVEGETGTVGISDFGQAELAEVVYTELPSPGDEVVQGSPFGTIEAMKTVAELISPVSGEVVEVNENLDSDPRLVNMDPYGDGWMIRIHIHDHDEIDSLLTPQDYIMYISGEEEMEG